MENAEETTAEAVRAVLGQGPEALGDDDALEQLLNPAINRYRLETLQLSVHAPLGRAMHHPAYTFLKKISHTADSQDQRHRMVPASRPLMTLTDTRRPDYITPPLVAANAEARAVYEEAMERAWAAKNRLLEMDVPLEQALYLLPNAKALRFHESGSLLYLAHKWVMRTCFNAQEEIYRASMDELEQVRAVHPRLARHMGPPCVLRYQTDHAHLHRGRALLRHPGLAEVPRRRAAAVGHKGLFTRSGSRGSSPPRSGRSAEWSRSSGGRRTGSWRAPLRATARRTHRLRSRLPSVWRPAR